MMLPTGKVGLTVVSGVRLSYITDSVVYTFVG